jgi:hypothetical protein
MYSFELATNAAGKTLWKYASEVLSVMLKNLQNNQRPFKLAALRVRRWRAISTILQRNAWRLIGLWQRRKDLHVMLKLFWTNTGVSLSPPCTRCAFATKSEVAQVNAQPLKKEVFKIATDIPDALAWQTALANFRKSSSSSAYF